MMWCYKFRSKETLCLLTIYLTTSIAVTVPIYDEMNISLKGIVPSLTNSEVYSSMVTRNASSRLLLNVIDLSPKITFLIIQTHSHNTNITLSYAPNLNIHNHVNGTNLGLVYELTDAKQAYAFNFDTEDNIDVYVSIHAYIGNAPIPGGCNMEMNILNAAIMTVWYTDDVTTVESFPARVSYKKDCDLTSQTIQHDYYHFFMNEDDHSSEEYFKSMKKMMTVESILKHGSLVPKRHGYGLLRRTFSTYPRIGSVYVVVATFKNQSSAYIPVHTYACTNTESCEVAGYLKFFYALISILGLTICLLGHYIFRIQLFLFGFTLGSIISYILLASLAVFSFSGIVSVTTVAGFILILFWYLLWKYNGISLKSVVFSTILIGIIIAFIVHFGHSAVFIISLLCGATVGTFWLMCWSWSGVPLWSIVLATLCLGFQVASITYFGFPDGSELLQNDINFWSLFVCIIVVIAFLCLPLAHYANILSCSVLGAYATILPFDLTGSQLRFILMNVIRRGTVTDFNTAVIDPPFQWRDGLIVGLWALLCGGGFFIQHWLTKGRAPFPPHTGSFMAFETSSGIEPEDNLFIPKPSAPPPVYSETDYLLRVNTNNYRSYNCC